MNCRWNKDKKKDLPIKIFRNCSVYLEKQLKLFLPRFIVAMGNKAKQALAFNNVKNTIKELGIPETNILKMSFPFRAVNETDEERVEKLKRLAKLLAEEQNGVTS
jgi:uracil-DNA glycosylase